MNMNNHNGNAQGLIQIDKSQDVLLEKVKT